MRSKLFSWVWTATVCLSLTVVAAAAETPTLAVEELRPGMKGVAYTVFEGVRPEAMEVEILGVLKSVIGPRKHVILVRLRGEKAEFTGVVAGMSGSPVYIEGRLVGALAYKVGIFNKEPIGGVTPIADMLEISEQDATPAPATRVARASVAAQAEVAGPGLSQQEVERYRQHLAPIEAPLVFAGFSEETVKRFAPQFAEAGMVPVMGAGSVTDEKQPEPIEPGSAVSMVFVRGDLNIAAGCTVTSVDAERLLACGHPLFHFGRVDIPLTKSRVLATVASDLASFKIMQATETAGALVQDRLTGVLGRLGQKAEMVPVNLSLKHNGETSSYNFEVLNNPRITPAAVMATVFNALRGVNQYGEDVSFRMAGSILVKGYPAVSMEDIFVPGESQPTAYGVALTLGGRFSRIYSNPWAGPRIEGVDLEFEVLPERRWARLETARTDVVEARPGDAIVIEAVLRPYRGERILRQIPVRIPASAPRGPLRILVSDGDTLDRMRNLILPGRQLDLAATIAALNKERPNHRLYVSVLQSNPQAMVEDKVMPTLPLSVINVMDGLRGTRDMVVMSESSVDESSTVLDYAVSGAQVLMVTVK
ncbi:MAG: SpoIVB peptidase S55 [Acidobacteria bacterium]|nr:SpoIVB peptidase S55 [Acidobacteriota bacterium]